jgi:hypothetical protein
MNFYGMRERRKDERGPAPGVGLVDVYMASPRNRVRLGPSLLEDLSTGGVCIRMDQAVSIGMVVYLTNRYVRCTACVRNCRPMYSGFYIGLEFLPADKPASAGAELVHSEPLALPGPRL